MRKAIKKDPDIIDTRIVYKFDTLWTNAIKFKDSVNVNFKDSLVITNDTVVTTLKKVGRNKMIVKTIVKPYPIYRRITQYKTIVKTKNNKFAIILWQIVFAICAVIGVSKFVDIIKK